MVAEAVRHLRPGAGRRDLTPEERGAVEDVLDAARAWAEGRLPLSEFVKVGPLPYRGRWTTNYGRVVAVATAARDDPRRACLLRAIDKILGDYGRPPADGGGPSL